MLKADASRSPLITERVDMAVVLCPSQFHGELAEMQFHIFVSADVVDIKLAGKHPNIEVGGLGHFTLHLKVIVRAAVTFIPAWSPSTLIRTFTSATFPSRSDRKRESGRHRSQPCERALGQAASRIRPFA